MSPPLAVEIPANSRGSTHPHAVTPRRSRGASSSSSHLPPPVVLRSCRSALIPKHGDLARIVQEAFASARASFSAQILPTRLPAPSPPSQTAAASVGMPAYPQLGRVGVPAHFPGPFRDFVVPAY